MKDEDIKKKDQVEADDSIIDAEYEEVETKVKGAPKDEPAADVETKDDEIKAKEKQEKDEEEKKAKEEKGGKRREGEREKGERGERSGIAGTDHSEPSTRGRAATVEDTVVQKDSGRRLLHGGVHEKEYRSHRAHRWFHVSVHRQQIQLPERPARD